VCFGVCLVALATYAFILGDIIDWAAGWIAGILGVSLFCTAPLVVASVVRDFRDSRTEESLLKRFSLAGASLVGLGVLEFVLAFAGLEFAWLFFSMGNH